MPVLSSLDTFENSMLIIEWTYFVFCVSSCLRGGFVITFLHAIKQRKPMF